MTRDDASTIREQIEFYGARASQYPQTMELADRQVLARCPLSSHCLELASGSGRWTQQLLRVCRRITAVDASPEMHARNRALTVDS
jgi:ubiquinone/menaquinone biosynthesis C-methylase UbiE